MTTKYRKKPVVIEAMRFDGSWSSATRIIKWADNSYFVGPAYEHPLRRKSEFDGSNGHVLDDAPAFVVIRTLEGDHRADAGDYIIKGVEGEFYPCKPDIFAATYEEVAS